MKKRLFSIVLSLCMVLALMSQMAFADTVTGITYLDASGAQQTCDNATAVTEDDTTWGTDNETTWYVAQSDVTIESRVTVTGDVHLILADGCNLTVNGGIYVSSWTASKLTIYGQENGTGELYAYASSGSDYAGIGGNKEPYGTSGEITINGGNITAVGDGIGAGIGGGDMGGFECITINGGTVTATGGNNGGSSGIGTFEGGSTSGTITISGGTVMATGTNHGIDASFMGTISTGNDGHAVIFASYTNSMGSYFRYSSSQNRDSWRGVIFEGNSGQIYGDDITPSESFEIPSDKTLTIDSGKSLTIPAGKTLTVTGKLTNNGKFYVDGTLNGTVNGNGDVYYNLAPTDCTVSSTGIEKHNEKTYAKEESEITLTPDTPQVGYLFDSWEVSPESVQINNNNSFTMPNEALTVTAKWIECPHDGDKETRNAKEATCTEAGYSGDVYCLVCNEMITKGHDINMASHKLNYIPKTDATVTETGNDEYWQCTVCDKYFSDAEGTNEITDLESWKAGDGKIDKLPPEIIEGKGQSITEGEKKALSFTSNAAYSDFIRVELDGSELSEENYEKAEGSIIITLDADYVATLPAGEHTIGIVSESGTATTTFTVAEKAAPGTSDDSDRDSKADADKNAKTGDDANLALWLALMLLAGAGITGTTIYTRRKRTNE
ncbi:InlB B-repeat-containing protein [Anaerovoracaceae bacterium SGI.174]